jgi:antitoxin CptB
MEDRTEYNRICWHSRRGMLELDLLLEPFVQQCYLSLAEQQQGYYRKLLECEDQDLHRWFLGRVRPQDEELVDIVERILAFSRGTN